jgi:hypothetical protein
MKDLGYVHHVAVKVSPKVSKDNENTFTYLVCVRLIEREDSIYPVLSICNNPVLVLTECFFSNAKNASKHSERDRERER